MNVYGAVSAPISFNVTVVPSFAELTAVVGQTAPPPSSALLQNFTETVGRVRCVDRWSSNSFKEKRSLELTFRDYSASQELDNGRSDVAIGLACGVAGFLNDNPGNNQSTTNETDRQSARNALAGVVGVAMNATVLERGVVQVRLLN